MTDAFVLDAEQSAALRRFVEAVARFHLLLNALSPRMLDSRLELELPSDDQAGNIAESLGELVSARYLLTRALAQTPGR